MKNTKYQLAASLISTTTLDLSRLVKDLKKNKIDQLHFDVMDGVFVPRYGLYPELITQLKTITSIPIDVHLMIEKPENYIDVFVDAGADIIFPHVESTNHLHRVIKLIKDKNVKAGVALNPATPLNVLDYVLDDIDVVMLMAINPGIVGHKFIPQIYNKIKDLKLFLKNYPNIKIQIDGGVNFETAPKMIESGADILICGAQSIFKEGNTIDKNLKKLRSILDK